MTAILGHPASASQATLAGFYAAIGCIWLLGVPLVALPVAGLEGLLHALLAARYQKKNRI